MDKEFSGFSNYMSSQPRLQTKLYDSFKNTEFFAADDQAKVPLCIGQATLNIEDYVKLVSLYKIKINKYYLSCSRD